jgi:aspartyl-tRNA(Asn)/glutamyl-tRNA(Gln) amidotransferase subunit A
VHELRLLSAAGIAARVHARDIRAEEVVQAHVDGLSDAVQLHAVVTTCEERALAQAKAVTSGPLAGVPLLVKDLFDTAGVRTTYGSSIFAANVPSRTASAVTRLEDAGAIVIGKANLHEFAWGTTSQNPHHGIVENPARPGRTPGGSSGGNAAALAACVSALGLGTDTGGSVRIPSACCDTVGFKPSYGKVPTDGCFPLSSSFDHVGPMARSVQDCALAYSVLSGEPVPAPRSAGLVVGILTQAPRASPHEPSGAGGSGDGGVGERIAEVVAGLERLGAHIVEAGLPEPEAEIVPLFLHEAAVAHRDLFPSRREEYGMDTRLKWDAAGAVPASAVDEARRALPRWRASAADAPAVDVVLCPTLGLDIPPVDVWEPDVRVQMTSYTRCFNFLGWPAIAIGDFQLAGRDDATVLGLALAWEQAYGSPGGRARPRREAT